MTARRFDTVENPPPQWALNWLVLQGAGTWSWDRHTGCWWLAITNPVRTYRLEHSDSLQDFMDKVARRSYAYTNFVGYLK